MTPAEGLSSGNGVGWRLLAPGYGHLASLLPRTAQEDEPPHARLAARGRKPSSGTRRGSPHGATVPGPREHLHEQPLPETSKARTTQRQFNGSTHGGPRAAKQQNASRISSKCRGICRRGHKKGHTLIESFLSVRLEKPQPRLRSIVWALSSVG